MLTSLRIQNFRSIRDATVKLGKVNLFIGPNNSGKSNFLKAIKFASDFSTGQHYEKNDFYKIFTRNNDVNIVDLKDYSLIDNYKIEYTAHFSHKHPEIIPQNKLLFSRDGFLGRNHTHLTDDHEEHIWNNLDENDRKILDNTPNLLRETIWNTEIYKIDPARIIISNNLSSTNKFDPDGYNLTNFLFNLSQNYKNIFKNLEENFRECVNNLTQISTPADPDISGNLKIKFFDKDSIGYWAEEVSEGVLYFLALLCIVYQPNPPKLLLIEEPEKGIHPRRIREVMDFIFELAELRDVQIILTSHSPYVVDHFADIPECISVFDRENSETIIHNAGNLIAETNAALEAKGKKPIHYTDALGEHWVSGFLGGVPV